MGRQAAIRLKNRALRQLGGGGRAKQGQQTLVSNNRQSVKLLHVCNTHASGQLSASVRRSNPCPYLLWRHFRRPSRTTQAAQ